MAIDSERRFGDLIASRLAAVPVDRPLQPNPSESSSQTNTLRKLRIQEFTAFQFSSGIPALLSEIASDMQPPQPTPFWIAQYTTRPYLVQAFTNEDSIRNADPKTVDLPDPTKPVEYGIRFGYKPPEEEAIYHPAHLRKGRLGRRIPIQTVWEGTEIAGYSIAGGQPLEAPNTGIRAREDFREAFEISTMRAVDKLLSVPNNLEQEARIRIANLDSAQALALQEQAREIEEQARQGILATSLKKIGLSTEGIPPIPDIPALRLTGEDTPRYDGIHKMFVRKQSGYDLGRLALLAFMARTGLAKDGLPGNGPRNLHDKDHANELLDILQAEAPDFLKWIRSIQLRVNPQEDSR